MSNPNQASSSDPAIPLSALVSRINSSQVSAQRTASYYARSGALDACRFDEGYRTQLVFSCLTCRTAVNHGFCLACSMHCHVDHEVIETGKKRNFRCDCGTERLPNLCLLSKKPEGTLNDGNAYNQNFLGLFCHCSKSYDPDTETKDMIMCCRCQDWFHDFSDCIGVAAGQNQFDRLYVCANCVKDSPLLASYCSKAKLADSKDHFPGERACSRPFSNEIVRHGVYLPNDISARLCRCDECLPLIGDEKIQFLIESPLPSDEDDDESDDNLDSSDQVLKPEFDPEFILERALSNLPREVAIEGALKFRQFTDSIILGLKKITANDANKVITVEDVNSICASVLGKRHRSYDTPE